MLSHAVLRFLDSFFRHPLLYTLPFVLFTTVGGLYVAQQETVYRSGGAIFVEDRTMLSSLTGVRGAEGGRQTPAGYTSRQLTSLLRTDAFLAAVVEQSGLADPSTLAPNKLAELRKSIGAWESGENLMHVSVGHEQPEVAHGLAVATVESLIQWQIDTEVNQSTVAESFLAPLTEQYLGELTAARDALEEYLRANPEPADGGRPASEEIVLQGLTARVTEADDRYTDALAKEESARLATAQAESDVRNRLQLVDAPEMPLQPEGRLKASAMWLAVFMVCGGLVSFGAVVIGAVTDETMRLPMDVTRRLGVDVVAVLPDTSPWIRALGRSPQ